MELALVWREKLAGITDQKKFARWREADPETRTIIARELAAGIAATWPWDVQEEVFKQIKLSRKSRNPFEEAA